MDQIESADFNDYVYFARVIEAGGFSAAERRLGIPKSRLSRRIAGLEARLGVRLLQRSTRKLTLTDVGQRFLAHCQALLREAEAAERVAANLKAEPGGLVRLSMPSALLDSGLSQLLAEYLADFPKVSLETVVTGRRVDLIEEGIDLALRVRAPDDEDPQWATVRLWRGRARLVASPPLVAAYGGITTPAALTMAPALGAIAADRRVHWRLQGPGGELRELVLAPRLASEHFALRRQAARAGLGVTMLPEAWAIEDIQAGRLVEVLPAWQFPVTYLQAVYASQRGLPPAVRILLDRLRAYSAEGAGDLLLDRPGLQTR
ncbi:LysR substrate-binding domain-containing protein [Parachitinimonas caeni]|uniref:LysR substrate-binding domain-containing protein n=1 Tax=Parachitinimonas caeni TaxID=3031301 RepID=A0ABT7DXQ5_9NEIS|nr:LysR substrate-binding domain-containing protein [Parachitinimonas caeni]MDK2124847.1 LysR substrate-binding domain-containing protein [Parachitinimonas caeni]